MERDEEQMLLDHPTTSLWIWGRVA